MDLLWSLWDKAKWPAEEAKGGWSGQVTTWKIKQRPRSQQAVRDEKLRQSENLLALPRSIAQKKDPWVPQPSTAGLEGVDQATLFWRPTGVAGWYSKFNPRLEDPFPPNPRVCVASLYHLQHQLHHLTEGVIWETEHFYPNETFSPERIVLFFRLD